MLVHYKYTQMSLDPTGLLAEQFKYSWIIVLHIGANLLKKLHFGSYAYILQALHDMILPLEEWNQEKSE